MCCHTTKKATNDFRDEHQDQEEIVVWKIYEVVNGKLRSPMSPSPEILDIRPGDIVSNREDKQLGNEHHDDWYSEVKQVWLSERGIHVFTTKENAEHRKSVWEKYNFCLGDTYILVRCTAKMDDFVAFELPGFHTVVKNDINTDNAAVFMKINMSQADYDEAMSQL